MKTKEEIQQLLTTPVPRYCRRIIDLKDPIAVAKEKELVKKEKAWAKAQAERAKIVTPLGRFTSISKAAKRHNISYDTAKRLLRYSRNGWRHES